MKKGGAVVMMMALICSIGSGVVCDLLILFELMQTEKPPLQALPLMNIFFGKLIGNFNDYFLPNSTTTKDAFQKTVNENRSVAFP
jgi:hypothetical protein